MNNSKTGKDSRITEAARKCFFDHGYKGTSISEITREAGVAKGTFYNYYRSKADAFKCIWLDAIATESKTIRSLLKRCRNNKERIARFLHLLLMISSKRDSFVGRMLSRKHDFFYAVEEVHSQADSCYAEEEMRTLSRQMIDDLAAIIRDGVEKKEFRELDTLKVARVMRGLVFLNLFLEKIEIMTELTREEFVDGLGELLVSALEKRA